MTGNSQHNLYDLSSSQHDIRSRDCKTFLYDFDDHIILSVIFGMCFVIGLALVFTGYRFFRTSLFFQSSFIVCTLTYLGVSNLLQLSDVLDGVISASAGLVLGILAMFVTPLGLLFSSLVQSLFVTSCILYTVHVFVVVQSIYAAPSVFLVTLLCFLLPVLKWQRSVSIMYICSFGTILIMLAIDFFCNLSMLRLAAYENALLLERTVRPCWFSWILLGIWPLLLFCGCVVQFLKTAKDYDHTCDKYWYKRSSEPRVRLLSNKSDVIARKWIEQTSSPTPSDKLLQDTTVIPIGDDEVFLKEDMTSV